MIKTFQYRLYPTKAQDSLLRNTIETCRRVYNDCLSERKLTFESTGKAITKYEQLRHVKDIKNTNPYAKGIHSHILQVAVGDLDGAFRNFFRRVKGGGGKPGYPRFKSRNRFNSFGLKEYGNGFKIDGRRLKVYGIGRIRVRWHRELPSEPSTLRITRKADGWYACFSCECAPEDSLRTGNSIGIDVGISHLITDSNGNKIDSPKWYRDGQRKLRVLQRSVSRKMIGGANRRESSAILQRYHLRISRQRKDFINKVARGLIENNDLVAIEDLTIRNMVKNRHLSKSIMDAGWNYLAKRLCDKAEEAGRTVVKVDPSNTSKMCSGCGNVLGGMTLSDRWFLCPHCGLSLDRDHNAAINILRRGILRLNGDGRFPWAQSSLMQEGLAQKTSEVRL